MMVLVSKCRYSPGGLVFLEMIDKTCTVQEEQCQRRRPNNTNDTIHKETIIYHRSRKMRGLVTTIRRECKMRHQYCNPECSENLGI